MSSHGNYAPRRNNRSFGRNKNNYFSSSQANYDSSLNSSTNSNIKINRWRSTPPNLSKSFDNYRQRLPSTSSTSSASSASTTGTSSSSNSRKSTCNNQSSFHHKQGKSEKPVKSKICVFCKKNREPREFYSTHTLKDEAGNTICPILFKYTCALCGATGPESHTRSYCQMANVAKDIFDDASAFLEFGNFAVQSKVA